MFDVVVVGRAEASLLREGGGMDPVAIVAARGGVVRIRELLDAGVSSAAIKRAKRDGRLMRPRNGWVATPGADPMLRAAAELGVVVTCVTRAERAGLWTFGSDRVHVAAPRHHSLPRETTAHVHWARPVVPRPPGLLEDGIENTLVLIAECQPFEAALVVWESALRVGLIQLESMRRLPLSERTRRVLEAARPHADSGVETVVVPRLRWLNLPLRRQVVIAGRPVDLLIGDRLVLQIDGGHHVGAQRDADNAHDAQLKLMGYHVIRVSYHQVFDDWPAVHERIVLAIAQRLHLAPAPSAR
ncbi:type IV toxin-antitoxin system AbiEi family antitoxin domain-containing protein [Microbacterium sp. NPDC096154]|uniref:type IV toxin-antitoxin system AbiEi family antitoxin domain-containing protein n=1 Tax=Microbacterium sp. NPDC096154 TaxID=3155549 RepID=UPI00332B3039